MEISTKELNELLEAAAERGAKKAIELFTAKLETTVPIITSVRKKTKNQEINELAEIWMAKERMKFRAKFTKEKAEGKRK